MKKDLHPLFVEVRDLNEVQSLCELLFVFFVKLLAEILSHRHLHRYVKWYLFQQRKAKIALLLRFHGERL